ncbi:Txe/YoeB family addiction module toxin [Magnetofaba australis]|uniref:Putative mRNA interferase YoeB n=1 Tax=Magnetofaba australis IT-1 TaxID=1434232 RepID=A0A1Y2K8M2_9PROT|nr:Txe/YoeB family addiction module toxin [Magnetofaba australis]OSM07032.1 putative Txe/YoeB family addiction module toxin [Magnetofaba australis IT-1]
MNICFTPDGWADYEYWIKENDRKMVKRLNELIRDIQRDPFSGIGKPERLKENLTGYWSRRINSEHRLVYAIDDGDIVIIQCRFHY